MLCAKFGANWLTGSGEIDFLNFITVFSLFREYLNKSEFPSPKNALSQVWSKLGQWFLKKGFFLYSPIYIHYIVIIYSCREA